MLSNTEIEEIVQLGRYAFSEGDPPGNVCMVVLKVFKPTSDHIMKSFCIKKPAEAIQQASLLKLSIIGNFKSTHQNGFLAIESYPISLGAPEYLLNIIKYETTLGGDSNSPAQVVMGSSTKNDSRFLRWFWEVQDNHRWRPFTKGGRYQKWCGLETHYIDWGQKGIRPKLNVLEKYPYLNGNYGWVIKYEGLHFLPGLTYTNMARGSLGCRLMNDAIPGHSSHAIYPKRGSREAWLALLNTHIASALLRIITQSLTFETGYVARLPVIDPIGLEALGIAAINEKQALSSSDLTEKSFDLNRSFPSMNDSLNGFIQLFIKKSFLHMLKLLIIEGQIECRVWDLYKLDQNSKEFVTQETGIPAAWLPRSDDDSLLKLVQQKLIDEGSNNAGNSKLFQSEEEIEADETEITNFDIGRPVPSEFALEDLSRSLQIHPSSVYESIIEGIEKRSLRYIYEERRITEDRFTAIVLRLLGHRWPKHIEAGEPLPDWADKDGIIPLTEACGENTLSERVRERIGEEFPGGKVQDIELEFEEIMGTILEKWLARAFFKHHISQFKKRPIAWQIESRPPNGGDRGRKTRQVPVFSCLVYCHKLDGDLLHKIKTQYVWYLRDRFETELRTLDRTDSPTSHQIDRISDLKRWIEELRDFDARLDKVSQEGFDCTMLKDLADEPLDKWTSRDGKTPPPITADEFIIQEKQYDPDLNDGVRVNIAPLQEGGLLAVDVLAKKDLDKAISDRAEWRADERRWCREGKLPRPGWWKDGE